MLDPESQIHREPLIDPEPLTARERARSFRALRILGRTFSIWFGSLPQLLLITGLIHGPMLVLAHWLRATAMDFRFSGLLAALVSALAPTFGSRLAEGFVVLLVFRRLRGDSPDVVRSIRGGAQRFGAVAAIAVLTGATVVAAPAYQLLRIWLERSSPGDDRIYAEFVKASPIAVFLIYALVFCVAIPAAVVEGRGPLSAFNRSRLLTAGHRTRILGVWFLLGLATHLLGKSVTAYLPRIHDLVVANDVVAIVNWLFASFSCVLPVVLYHDLREIKEGIGIEELLKVFE